MSDDKLLNKKDGKVRRPSNFLVAENPVAQQSSTTFSSFTNHDILSDCKLTVEMRKRSRVTYII